METRNILNSSSSVIGSLSLPDGTSEDIWTFLLAQYAAASTPAPVPAQALKSITVTGTGNVTTSSGTASTVGSMTYTPVSGKYLVFFSGTNYTSGASAEGEFGVYVGGVLQPESRRDIKCNLTLLGGLVTISLNSIGVGTYTGTEISLDGTQTVDVKFKSNNGGTIGFGERVMTLLKVE